MNTITHNQIKTYNYRGFVVNLYFEQYTKWWFYQFYYARFGLSTYLEWSGPFENEADASEVAEIFIDELSMS